MNRLEGRTAIITGGASGIGKAISRLFSNESANVVIADVDTVAGKQLENELQAAGRAAAYYCGDMSLEEDIVNAVTFAKNKFGCIDILVNNIGLFNGEGLQATEEEWHKCFQVNVVSHALCIKHCVPDLAISGHGTVVNIASISGIIAQESYLLYSTTKAALVNMARCLAVDLAKYHIRVNNVCPGTVWTESNAFYIGRDKGVDLDGANRHPEIGGKHPIGRVAMPEEIAQAVLFLASEDASFITGENLMVDGGYTIV